MSHKSACVMEHFLKARAKYEMRSPQRIKKLFIFSILSVLTFIILRLAYPRGSLDNDVIVNVVPIAENNNESIFTRPATGPTDIKYILQWTSPTDIPFVYMGVGRKKFIDLKCRSTNCYVTSDRNLLGDVTKFDVIAFYGPEVVSMHTSQLPTKRSPHQRYVFGTIESAHNYPLCSNHFDGFFNWTWTYKLDSDTRWGYIVIRDKQGNIVGPNTEMHWIKKEDMLPVTHEFKKILSGKTKAAAWFVSNCNTVNKREVFASNLEKELKKYDLNLDVYGECGILKCPRDDEDKCFEKVKQDYYFYLSFENSFCDDYVTEKLIHAVANNAVPVVYGGANYSRFLPEGSYLDAVTLGPEGVAAKINEAMHDLELYADYFKFTNHYTYAKVSWSTETNDYCGMCALLNNEAKVKKTKIYKDFQNWWDSYHGPSNAERFICSGCCTQYQCHLFQCCVVFFIYITTI